jgi:thioredoxin 1
MQQITENNWHLVCQMPKAIVEFSAPWCGPCRKQRQMLNDLEGESGGVFVGEVNIDENLKISDEMGVQSVPTIVVLENGKEKKRFTGLQRREVVQSVLMGA